jgi:hypothetical protein
MFKVKSFSGDKRTNGVWCAINDLDKTEGEFKIASISSFGFQNYYQSIQKPYERKKDQLTPEVQQRLLCQALAKHILLDWRSVSFDGENETPFTQEAAFEALTENPELLEFVQTQALNIANFKNEAQAAEVKNS